MIKRAASAVGLLSAVALLGVPASYASAQNKDLSDKSVSTLMMYAWSMTPTKFTTPQGKVIEVDKAKRNDVIVPIDVAREVIRVGRMSAYAQLCDLAEEQKANYQTLIRREEAKAKWTEQQLLYISQLHLFTVMTMTGKVQVVEKDGDKQVLVEDGKAAKTETCTDTERKKIQEQISAYIKSAPAPAPAAAKRAEPAPTTQKK